MFSKDLVQVVLKDEYIDMFEKIMHFYDAKTGVEVSRSAVIRMLIKEKYEEVIEKEKKRVKKK